MTEAPPQFSELLPPEIINMIGRLEFLARTPKEGGITGRHTSPHKGFSVEFAEHRQYVTGDDLRNLDWRVYGKSDRYYIKQYIEETNLRATLIVDASGSMAYAGESACSLGNKGHLSKFEYARYLASALGYLLIRQQDAVGLVTFDHEIRAEIRPSSNPTHLQTLLKIMEGTRPSAKTATGPIFHELAERFRKRGVVLILSDLFDDVASMLAGLKHFRHRRHDVILFHVLDPAELQFPFRNPTLFKGLEQYPEVLADPRSLRKAYLQEIGRFQQEIQKGCRGFAMDYQRIGTDQPLDTALTNYLAARMARVK
jgi:uncharacterized protein (DUF58 family)